ncbi:MAG: MalY/PatB family protein [Actinomycetota bacterium]
MDPLRQLSLDQLRERTSVKWALYPDDVLPLWVAEMDVPLADPVRRALVEAAERGDTGYAYADGYATAMADFAGARWGWELDVAATRIVPDVMRGIVEVLRLVTSPGDAVVINSPVYPPFYAFVSHDARRVVEAPLRPDGRLDLPGLETVFADLTRDGGRAAYLLCSPHNPTGTVHSRSELLEVARLSEAYGVRVVVDEIHAPIVYGPAQHVPYLSLPGTEHAFALLSASKAWNLAGAKAAIAVAGAAAAEELHRMPEEVGHGATHLGVLSHVAALRDGVGWLDDLLAGLDANRRLLTQLLAEHLPSMGYEVPDGTYLAWLDCRPLGLEDPGKVFLKKGRVALQRGSDFGTGGAGFVRLNFATSPEILTEAVRRMAGALAG